MIFVDRHCFSLAFILKCCVHCIVLHLKTLVYCCLLFSAMCMIHLLICTYSGTSSLEKGVCHGRATFKITFQHKTTISLKTREINWWILRCHQIIISVKFQPYSYTVYWQYLLIKAATLVFYTHRVFGNPCCHFVYD